MKLMWYAGKEMKHPGYELNKEIFFNSANNYTCEVPEHLAKIFLAKDGFIEMDKETELAIGEYPKVTLTCTTGKRFRLFKTAMSSFLNNCLDLDLITDYLICDDGSDEEDFQEMKRLYPQMRFFQAPRSGQPASLNLLFSQVKTEWFFHMEDDWQFLKKDHFIRKLLDIAKHDLAIKNVGLRKWEPYSWDLLKITTTGVRYVLHRFVQSATPEKVAATDAAWYGFSLNPGILHTETMKSLGLFDETMAAGSRCWDREQSRKFMAWEYRRANLYEDQVKHIGSRVSLYEMKRKSCQKENNCSKNMSECERCSQPIDVVLVTCKTKKEMAGKIKEIEKNTPERHRLIFTGKKASAAVNRNHGLDQSKSDIVVMIDDDIEGFYPGWLGDLTEPLKRGNAVLSSARLVTKDGKLAPMMGGNVPSDIHNIYDAQPSGYKGYKRVPTAAIAFFADGLRFDENFIGSGYEDTDFMNQVNERYLGRRIVVDNYCKLTHLNEEKNQGGEYFEHNKAYYLSKYPDDMSVINQGDWTKRK